MTGCLDSASAGRLAKLCGMFSSAHAGERANAAEMADKLIRSLGLTWPEVITPSPMPLVTQASTGRHWCKPDWRAMALHCLYNKSLLRSREFDFLIDISHYQALTPKQEKWLGDIYRRVAGVAA